MGYYDILIIEIYKNFSNSKNWIWMITISACLLNEVVQWFLKFFIWIPYCTFVSILMFIAFMYEDVNTSKIQKEFLELINGISLWSVTAYFWRLYCLINLRFWEDVEFSGKRDVQCFICRTGK